MKKTIKFFAAALAIVAAASCAKENPENTENSIRDNSPVELVDFIAEVKLHDTGESSTKTSLDSDKLIANWSENDAIMVFPFQNGTGGDNYCPYKGTEVTIINESINGTSAKFSGQAAYASNYFAVYPFKVLDKNNCYDNRWAFKKQTLQSQTVVANNFPQTSWGPAHIAMANSCNDGTIFDLKNKLAYLKFTIEYDEVYSIEVSANMVSKGENRELNNNVNLGGVLYYRPAKQSFNINTGDNTIIATNNNQPFEKGVPYFIALPAVEAAGFSMIGKDANGNIVFGKEKKSNLDISANTIYNLGTFGESSTEGVDVQINLFAEAVHKTDANGTIIGTDVTFTVQAPNASEVKDFRLTATLDGYRSYSTTNPNTSGVMTVLNGNKYLPRGKDGYYLINCEYTVNGHKHTPTVRVKIPEPVFSSSTVFTNSYSHYCNGYIDTANKMDAGTLQINRSSATINYDIVSLHPITIEVEINGQTFRTENSKYSSTTWNKELTSVPAGKHSLKTRVTFDGITKESTQDVYMTGLPMKSFNASDWNISNGAISDGILKLTNDASAELKCQTPTDINVSFELNTLVYGHRSTRYSYLYKFNIGDSEYSKSISGNVDRNQYFNCSGNIIWKANTQIKMIADVDNVDNNDPAYVDIYKLNILYR